MRFRTGLVVGFSLGYYYGAKAGRGRYEQIEALLERVRTTAAYRDLRIKVSDGVREGTTAARRLLEDAAEGPAGGPPPSVDDARAAYGDPSLN